MILCPGPGVEGVTGIDVVLVVDAVVVTPVAAVKSWVYVDVVTGVAIRVITSILGSVGATLWNPVAGG